MKLKISVNAEKEPSKSSTAASQFILNNDNFVSIAEFLNSTLSKTVNEVCFHVICVMFMNDKLFF